MLDKIDWHGLGSEKVPSYLADLTSDDRTAQHRGFQFLEQEVVMTDMLESGEVTLDYVLRNDTLYYVADFLIESLQNEQLGSRDLILRLLLSFLDLEPYIETDSTSTRKRLSDIRRLVYTSFNLYKMLIGDANPEIRRLVLELLARFPERYAELSPEFLVGLISKERDERVQYFAAGMQSILLALGNFMNLEPIATIHSPISEGVDEDWGSVVSEIELEPVFADGLRQLDSFSHALIVFFMHQSTFKAETDLVRRPRGRTDMPEAGIFAQRAKHRPNPIGITAIEIVGIEGNILRVRGLDAIDGSPVLDIKPYVPAFDRRDEATIPEWMDRLMQGYF